MLATGIIDPINRSFDIAGISETNTNISTINNTLKLSYTSPTGELVQLVKQLNTSTDNITIGDSLDVSPVLENNLGGYGQKSNEEGPCKALTNIDWTNTNNVVTKTFTDSNGITRTAVLLPVIVKH